ncbi:50S ribosomal protein L25 [Patescibacteria group bacterium]|nr:50S ribosomal protein L25 [Patescibacteria group bacterium]
MATISLKVQKRGVPTKEINQQRKAGKVPAVLYGKNQASQPLFVDEVVFGKVYQTAGESSLVDLIIDDGQPIKALIYDVQKDPVTDKITHVDFYQIDMSKPFTFTIPLVFVGEAKAIKELEGTLIKSLDEVEISCLPNDLIHEIEADISSLETFEDTIWVKDLKVPETITIKTDLEETVASVAPPHVEAAPAAEEAAGAEEGQGVKEGEEAPAEPKEDSAAPKTKENKKEKK